ncbi:MAG: hypothetical protein Kow0092_06130 [Deferrisomatales bacterium]
MAATARGTPSGVRRMVTVPVGARKTRGFTAAPPCPPEEGPLGRGPESGGGDGLGMLGSWSLCLRRGFGAGCSGAPALPVPWGRGGGPRR